MQIDAAVESVFLLVETHHIDAAGQVDVAAAVESVFLLVETHHGLLWRGTGA